MESQTVQIFITTGKFELPKLASRKRKAWIHTIINKPQQVWSKKKNRAWLSWKQSQKQTVQIFLCSQKVLDYNHFIHRTLQTAIDPHNIDSARRKKKMQTSYRGQFELRNSNKLIKIELEALHTLLQLIYIGSSKLCKIKTHMVGINTAVLLVKNLGSARRSVMIRMTRPRTIWAASLTSELSSFPVVTKRKLIVWNAETNKSKNC